MEQAPEQVGPGELVEGLRDWTVRRAIGTPQFYIIVGAYTMYLLINTTAHGFAVEHLTERGVSPKIAAGMLSLEALIGAGVSVVGGVMGEKYNPKTMLAFALAALVAGMTALAFARGYPLMFVYAVGVGIGYGLSFLGSTMLLLNYYGKRANLELYSVMCLISTSAALGPAFGGWARDTLGSFASVFLLCAAATLIMMVATMIMRPPVFREAQDKQAKARQANPERGGMMAATIHDPA
jgi:MFS family permease